MEPQINYYQHRNVLGILYLVFSIINLLLSFGLITLSSFIFSFVYIPQDALMVIELVKYVIIIYMIIFSIPSIIVGIGLIYQKEWAFTGALIIGILALPVLPIWTFIGIYSIILFFLYQRDKPYLENESKKSQ